MSELKTPRLCFVIESGTDVRLVEGLVQLMPVTLLARRIENGVEISQPPTKPVLLIIGSSSRLRFALQVMSFLWRRRRDFDCVLVQGYCVAALAANLMRCITATPTAMVVCSPVETYYRLRKEHPQPGKHFHLVELWGLMTLAWLNAKLGRHYVVLSKYLASVVRGHGFRGRIDTIPLYGIDTSVFCPPVISREAVKLELGLPVGGKLIFFSSRIEPEKDSECLLAAIRRLRKGKRDVWLLHRSGGFAQFKKDAERFGIGDRVIATDALHPHKDLPRSYQASDLCVQASRAEGLGFSALEALACEVPVVAASTGGLKETVVDGKTGWTYPAGDVGALTRCIEQMLDGPIEGQRRARAGRDLVRAQYEREIVFDRFLTLVRELAGFQHMATRSDGPIPLRETVPDR